MRTYKIVCTTNEYQAQTNPSFNGKTSKEIESGLFYQTALDELFSIAIESVSDDIVRFDEKESAIYNLLEEQASELGTTVEDYTKQHPKLIERLCKENIYWSGVGLYQWTSNNRYEPVYNYGDESFYYDGYLFGIVEE